MKIIELQNSSVFHGSLVLVNEHYPYFEDKTVLSLSNALDSSANILMEKTAAASLGAAIDTIGGHLDIVPVSGWRSRAEQEKIYSDSLKKNGKNFTKKYVAMPNHSEHQTGLAIDLALKSNNIDFICPDFPYAGICNEFRFIAKSFGFIQRYPLGKEKITGIAHEPWHFRYVGFPHSSIITAHDFALEEYIDFVKQFPYNNKHFLYTDGCEEFSVSYIPASCADATQLESLDGVSYSALGNNVDGFIITQWGYSS